ncbi:MAG: metal-dependent phosphohydrolase [Pseudomonadota bacterium]
MFDPNATVIAAFAEHTQNSFRRAFPDADGAYARALQQATQIALETLLNCDCPYHDLSHTILVTDVGQTILQGRQMARGDLSPDEWLQAVVAMLFHDIGYLKKLLPQDSDNASLTNARGNYITPPPGATDAFMTPYHVTRGTLYVQERFANDPLIDTATVMACIEMTRFPVPDAPAYQVTGTLPALVRAADLIGQMADPQYLQKLTRLFAEFVETGEAERLGCESVADLRANFPEFFYAQVHPYIGEGVEYLKRTQEGQRWIANLYHHLHINRSQDSDPKVRAPELVIDNSILGSG